MLQDNIVTMFGVSQKMQEDSIMEIKVYGVKDGETVFYSRAHQMKLQMEKDYGIYKGTAIKTKVLLHGDRYIRACDSIGYEFDMNGVSEKAPEGLGTKFSEKVAKIMDEKYQTTGELVSVGDKVKNFLNLESFKYYLQMPAYIYPESEAVQNFGFMTFVFNSIIVIGFAMVSQVILCSVCAFVISRKLSKRAGQFVLLFFLGGMMVPFASIMLPQLIMYREMGAYNNYAALLLPFLYPYGFYVYLYKGFLIRFREVILKRQSLTAREAFTSIQESVCHCLSQSFRSLRCRPLLETGMISSGHGWSQKIRNFGH